MILVVCAVGAELRGFAREGVTVVAVGIGPVDAAIGTSRAVAAQPYALVVNAGIGGGFTGRAAVGDAVVVTDERYVELGREDDSELQLPPEQQPVTACRADGALLERFRATRPAAIWGSGVTSATITTSAARAKHLAASYAPVTESMEGFAVLRAAAVARIAAVELRGISNIVGDRASGGWDFRAGASATVRLLENFIDAVTLRS